MKSYWLNFIRTGNPNGEGPPEWETHIAEGDKWMVFNPNPKPATGVLREKLDFIDANTVGAK
jgi:para-nitrobenzyl esterase